MGVREVFFAVGAISEIQEGSPMVLHRKGSVTLRRLNKSNPGKPC